ncbi:hypothetical protein BofuT4_uP091210.1 [Botrytis cinerea T4]|uniref:Uncharacterized protein n=1 Tax=Botryotinia fuckeliana (strain T4) TaxID=999810 RepID=G2YF41_BOTF4|nr:hypothetical protein BofuT4_uP091210.1 [Botrytis cinerea T4]
MIDLKTDIEEEVMEDGKRQQSRTIPRHTRSQDEFGVLKP